MAVVLSPVSGLYAAASFSFSALALAIGGTLVFAWRRRDTAAAYALILALVLALGGCFGETFQRGYVLPEGALEQIRLGASQEQVVIVLGTP